MQWSSRYIHNNFAIILVSTCIACCSVKTYTLNVTFCKFQLYKHSTTASAISTPLPEITFGIHSSLEFSSADTTIASLSVSPPVKSYVIFPFKWPVSGHSFIKLPFISSDKFFFNAVMSFYWSRYCLFLIQVIWLLMI